MMLAEDKWVGAYYPDSLILNPRSKVVMCLLFDKIIVHFPISSMACGGGSGMGEIALEETMPLLAEAGVIDYLEEGFVDHIQIDSIAETMNDDEDSFNRFYTLQVTALTLDFCIESGAVPVTDDHKFTIPTYLLKELDLTRFSRLQASALASQCLEIALPPLAEIPDEDILKAREELKEQLVPFRRAMMALAPSLREGVEAGAKPKDIVHEARYIIDTQVSPSLGELKDRLRKEKGKFWRRLIFKYSTAAPKLVYNWATQGLISATMQAISDGKNLALDIIDHDSFMKTLQQQRCFNFLISLSESPTLNKYYNLK